MQDMTERYVSPFSTRYASDEMQELFSQRHKFLSWRDMWIYLAESEKELGLNITDEQIEEMRANRDRLDQRSGRSWSFASRGEI